VKVAIDSAIAYIKSHATEPIDEVDLRTKLEGALPLTVQNQPTGPENSKRKETTAFTMFPDEQKLLYATQTEKGRLEFAGIWIDEHDGDLDDARVDLMRSDVGMNGINDALKTVILTEISTRALEQWQGANLIDKQKWLSIAKLADQQAQNVGSEQGQGLQAQNQRIAMARVSGPLMDYLAMLDIKHERLAKRFPNIVSDHIRNVLIDVADAAIAKTVKLVGKSKAVTRIVLRAALRDAGLTFREIFESSVKTQGEIRKSIYKSIRQHPELRSLSIEDALELANILAASFESERFKLIRQELEKKKPIPDVTESDTARIRKRLPELIRLANMGALNVAAFRNVLAAEYGLPQFSQALATRLFNAAQSAQDKPEGSQRDEAIRSVYDMLKRESGISNTELLTSWWYASILSGIGTQGRNIIGNAAVLVDNFLAFAAREPATIPSLISALWRGFSYNIAGGEFSAIIKRGAPASRIGLDVREASQAFENAQYSENSFVRFLGNARFVSRFMLAVDSFFYDGNVEMRATWDAWKKGREGGLTGSELKGFIADMLNIDPDKPLLDYGNRTAAQVVDQEISEGHTNPNDRNRRVIEILEQERPSEIIENSSNFALVATLNDEPKGLLGFVARSVIAARNKFPILIPIVPFVRISANVGNMLLQHSPLALARIVSHQRARAYGEIIGVPTNISLEEWQQLRAKVVLSHMALIGLWMLSASESDDDDPSFQVTGSMETVDPNKRRQLEEQGVRRYSLKIGGRYWDYRQSPLAIPLAFIGNWSDSKRYAPDKWAERTELTRFATALAGAKAVILDQNFLSSVGMLLDRGPQLSKDAGARSIASFAGRTVGGLVPSIFKEIDTWANGDVVKAHEWWEFLQKELPVARWSVGEGPVLNDLGEPIQRPRYPWTFLSSGVNKDPVWKALSKKANAGVFLPVISAAATVLRDGKREPMDRSELKAYQKRVGVAYREWFESEGNLERFKAMTPDQAKRLFSTTFSDIRERERMRQ
nr:hypothetical protein [Pyrinomonadaceae bacterium]